MSNFRQAPSPNVNSNNRNPRRPEMQVTELEETGGIVMMAHYDDAQLNHNNRGNNSTLSPEQANRATRTANASSSHAATNTNFIENPPSPASRQANYTCSHCSAPGHRRPECPLLPCRHCDVMGHLGIDCPEMAKVRSERRQVTSRRWYENNRMNRG